MTYFRFLYDPKTPYFDPYFDFITNSRHVTCNDGYWTDFLDDVLIIRTIESNNMYQFNTSKDLESVSLPSSKTLVVREKNGLVTVYSTKYDSVFRNYNVYQIEEVGSFRCDNSLPKCSVFYPVDSSDIVLVIQKNLCVISSGKNVTCRSLRFPVLTPISFSPTEFTYKVNYDGWYSLKETLKTGTLAPRREGEQYYIYVDNNVIHMVIRPNDTIRAHGQCIKLLTPDGRVSMKRFSSLRKTVRREVTPKEILQFAEIFNSLPHLVTE